MLSKKTIVVTGATGHLGLVTCEALIKKGYRVIGGVRRTHQDIRVQRLQTMGVETAYLDVLKPGTLDDCLTDADGLFHLAAIYQFIDDKTDNLIQDTAVGGTLNCLKMEKKNNVNRVVMTSSTVAVGSNAQGNTELNESHWNKTSEEPYALAKTKAELAAYAYAEKNGLSLCSILPSGIIGPGFMSHNPSTLPLAMLLAQKLMLTPPLAFSFVDVRDVANAHIQAYENLAACGRYIVSTRFISMEELFKLIKTLQPDVKVPNLVAPKWSLKSLVSLDSLSNKLLNTPRLLTKPLVKEFSKGKAKFSSSRAKRELNWTPRPFEESIMDTLQWINSESSEELTLS